MKSAKSTSTRMATVSRYAEAGLSVVPKKKNGLCTCGNENWRQPGDHPRTEDATTDPDIIRQYWTDYGGVQSRLRVATASQLCGSGKAYRCGGRSLPERHHDLPPFGCALPSPEALPQRIILPSSSAAFASARRVVSSASLRSP
jgi:hypothetical protein